MLHGIEFDDLGKAHEVGLAERLIGQEAFSSSSDSARAISTPPVGGMEGPDSRKRPLS